ncbi:MAG: DUF3160 domain-containing protein [Candidatus Obscuribacterales bacterium]|nr:DUF3160 domain-containing protein [Candidatus Obscuribacterales bacterium]
MAKQHNLMQTAKTRNVSLFCVFLLSSNFALGTSAQANPFDDLPFLRPAGLPGPATPSVPTKEMSLEDFFPKTDLPYMIAVPIDMTGLTVNGLQPAFVPKLGQDLFQVVDNAPFNTMAEIYRDNRLKGKSNFVTTDSIVHPYFAISNSIMASVVKSKLCPGLILMLTGMLKASAEDYKTTEDAEVKEDIQRNNAYICVALKLLDPTLPVPDLGAASKLVEAELKNINSGRNVKSAIFEVKEDFAFYRPVGWYNYDAQLQQFYRCRQWLSRMSYPLSDTEALKSAVAPTDSKFRRSVLLFRSLDRATINGAPAMSSWEKFNSAFTLMGARENKKEHPLLPSEYKKVFRTGNQQLSNMLQGLSEPFYRTKLLLSVRRNQPVELGSTSILQMAELKKSLNEAAAFRLFPLVDEPEWAWLCALGHLFTDERANADASPFALIELYARGSVLATNVLSELSWKLDPNLFNYLPALINASGRKKATSNGKDSDASTEGRWAILSHYFKSQIESGQTVLKTDLWMRHRLESAAAAWVDSHIASLTVPANVADSSVTANGGKGNAQLASNVTSANETTQATANAMLRPAVAHYLEPAPQMYKAMRLSMQQQIDDLSAIGYFPEKYRQQAVTFTELCQRLETIAEKEVTNQYVSPPDAHYLGDIDTVLEKISSPVASTLFLDSDTAVDKTGQAIGGANLCLGRPGQLFILMRSLGHTTLSRGAVYTYFELAGGPLKKEHWARKLEYSLVRSPNWTAEFDVIQSDAQAPKPIPPKAQ